MGILQGDGIHCSDLQRNQPELQREWVDVEGTCLHPAFLQKARLELHCSAMLQSIYSTKAVSDRNSLLG